MRDQLLTLLRALSLGTFRVASDLPYSNSGQELFLKNIKTIYVDNPQKTVEPLIATLNSNNVDRETTTIQVYFTSDAKQLPSNYDALVASIRALKEDSYFSGFISRECDYTTEYVNDIIQSQFEFRFTHIS